VGPTVAGREATQEEIETYLVFLVWATPSKGGMLPCGEKCKEVLVELDIGQVVLLNNL
jgi:hypothetical protein